MSIRGKYHFLDLELSEEWIHKLLGRIVLRKDDPTFATAPPEDRPDGTWIPQNIVKDLADKAVSYPTLKYLLDDFTDMDQKAKITQFFQQHASRKLSTKTTITAIDVERIDMSNMPYKLKMLMLNEDYAREAKDFVIRDEKPQKRWMVTGIFVSNSLTVVEEASKGTKAGASANAPIGALGGATTQAFDVSADANYERGNTTTMEYQIKTRTIFAVAYTRVSARPIQPDKGRQKRKFIQKMRMKKHETDIDYELFINTAPGADLFHGKKSSDDEGEGGEDSEEKISTNGKVEALAVEGGSGQYSFITPDSMF